MNNEEPFYESVDSLFQMYGGKDPAFDLLLALHAVDGPEWWHVSGEELGIKVPDGPLERVAADLLKLGLSEPRFSFVDWAPGVTVDEQGCYHVCRSRIFRGRLNGEEVFVMVSPTEKRYLEYRPE